MLQVTTPLFHLPNELVVEIVNRILPGTPATTHQRRRALRTFASCSSECLRTTITSTARLSLIQTVEIMAVLERDPAAPAPVPPPRTRIESTWEPTHEHGYSVFWLSGKHRLRDVRGSYGRNNGWLRPSALKHIEEVHASCASEWQSLPANELTALTSLRMGPFAAARHFTAGARPVVLPERHPHLEPLCDNFWSVAVNVIGPATATPLFKRLRTLSIFKMHLTRALPRFMRVETLDLTGCTGLGGTFLPLSSARHVSKLVLDGSDVEEVPAGMPLLTNLSLAGCCHLTPYRWLPDSSGRALHTLSLRRARTTNHCQTLLPPHVSSLRVLDVSHGSLAPPLPTLDYLRILDLANLTKPLYVLPDLPLCRRLNVSTELSGSWKQRNSHCVVSTERLHGPPRARA